jgi:hypothetical protein
MSRFVSQRELLAILPSATKTDSNAVNGNLTKRFLQFRTLPLCEMQLACQGPIRK